jgi:pimeloyl-ACP methyl ester carboxylesterase
MGTSHGAYKFTRKPDGDILAMNVIEEIHRKLPNTHLVMHGSSSVPQDLQDIINANGGKMKPTWGVPVEEIQRGIKHGVRKINIDTDNRMAMTGADPQGAEDNPEEFDPRKYLKPAFIGVATWTLMGSPVSSARIADDAQTRYPIVLAHGVLGFGYIHKQSYWRDIPETLRAHGANVYVTQVSAFHSSEIRGEQLLAQVERIRKETGASKVNLIGHSHGAFSVRYVAGKRPDWVASVTSVAGPTQGSDVADWLVQLDGQHPYAAMAILELGHLMGWLINQLSDQQLPLDTRAAVTSLSALGAQDFNRQFPAGVPGHPCGPWAVHRRRRPLLLVGHRGALLPRLQFRRLPDERVGSGLQG